MDTIFHPGEVAVQRRMGVADRLREIGDKVIRDHMPEQHREFFALLPTLLVGSVDASNRPWASMLVGPAGFVHALDARHLRIDALPDANDPLASQLAIDAPLGVLGLEPATRRRNRLNGRVVSMDSSGFVVEVDQSFGNCPKYIQARTPNHADRVASMVRRLGAQLDDASRALIETADTLFIASAAPSLLRSAANGGVDMSHRGGRPGFVRVEEIGGKTVLTWPDFSGNFFFNTLGNIVAHPRAGLLFVDYQSGDLLQLTGQAGVIDEGADLRSFEGAQFLIRMELESAIWREGAVPMRWTMPQQAPQLASTGTWRV